MSAPGPVEAFKAQNPPPEFNIFDSIGSLDRLFILFKFKIHHPLVLEELVNGNGRPSPLFNCLEGGKSVLLILGLMCHD